MNESFKNWFGSSTTKNPDGSPKVFYHGTSSDVDEFKTINGGNQWGRGHYFTSSPEIASQYATGTTSGAHARIAPEGNAAPNVIPVHLKMEKPFVMDAPIDVGLAKSAEKSLGYSLKDYVWSGMKNRDLHQMLWQGHHSDIDHTNQFLQSIGYDGIRERSPDSIHMVFDPTHIKSSIGNSGAFSPGSKKLVENSLEAKVDCIRKSKQYNEGKEFLHDFIDINGIKKPTKNSLGTPIHHSEYGIRNFYKWFGDSKAVDSSGRPHVYYHGTHSDISTFVPNSSLDGLIFVSPSEKYASNFATAQGANVIPVYVKTNNMHPKISHASHEPSLGKTKYDTFRVKDSSLPDEPINIAVRFPHQLKSYIGNSGNFSNSNHINEETNQNCELNEYGYITNVHLKEIRLKTFHEFLMEAKVGDYASIKASVPDEIKEAVSNEEFSTDVIPSDDLHCTLCYSIGTSVDHSKIDSYLKTLPEKLMGKVSHLTKFDALPKNGERPKDQCTVVMEVDCSSLEKIHRQLLKLGLKHSYDDYRPHVSLVYDVPIKEAEEKMRNLEKVVVGKSVTFHSPYIQKLNP